MRQRKYTKLLRKSGRNSDQFSCLGPRRFAQRRNALWLGSLLPQGGRPASFASANPRQKICSLFFYCCFFNSFSRSFSPAGPFFIASSTRPRICAGILDSMPAMRSWGVTVIRPALRVKSSAAFFSWLLTRLFIIFGTGAWATDCSRD